MRDFASTPEPAGAPVGEPPTPDEPRFVIQQHDATRLHWDLRLEHDGVLLSWALPRGVPWSPDENRLAVHTEDHPLEYLNFHGEIPEGQYGAGEMTIWDRGTYVPEKVEDDSVTVTLKGHRVEGTFALFSIGDRDWMIHRKVPPQDPERRPVPTDLRPMRPTPGELPDDGWGYEIRWVGARTLLTNDAGHVTIVDADGEELSDRFPEVRRIGRSLAAIECVLDAVIVGVGRDRQPVADPANVERRLDASSASQWRRLSEDRPVAAILVDLLWLEGHPALALSYEARRELLLELELQGPAWQAPRHHTGDGGALLEVARAQGLAGLVAKRLDSRYEPGATSPDWIEVSANRT
ncbi:MAG: ATP-dependent DNA ligase [Actinobacteria bacterium]|nr:ATP-dependent DNA ligase [Actinomycetota bacterium]